MLITTYKTVDIEAEVDVDMDDILREFGTRKDEATATYVRRLVPAIDAMTRILASIPDDVIAAIPDDAREVICERLMDQAARYDKAV